MLNRLESLLDPTRAPNPGAPPAGLARFYWHFARQVRGPFAALLTAGFFVALLDAMIPLFIGHLVTLVTQKSPAELLAEDVPLLLGMAFVVLVLRPIAMMAQMSVRNLVVNPGFTNLIRWQTHWHVVRQSWAFFQNDFAGRIATKIMQTGPALRMSMVSATDAVWYILVYGTSALVLMALADPLLALPTLAWFAAYLLVLRAYVPPIRDRSRDQSEARAILTGRIVDSYTNILTVKLFARAREEDAYVRDAVDEHTGLFRRQLRLILAFGMWLWVLNAALVTFTGAMAIVLWTRGLVEVGTIAMVLPLTLQIAGIAGRVAMEVADIFENVGVVQEGMSTIASPLQLPDAANAKPLVVRRGAIRFEHVSFGYGRAAGVIEELDLAIAPGEKIGLIGRSGAGKSTLINLLLRFFDVEAGRIMIDGENVSRVTQESLRAQISVVTQDTSLLHRSIRDNIRYGRPQASEAEVEAAARRAHAHDFILDLEDFHGRTGYEAHVGERGVKLSGGQRQRIAIARVILKNAPILVLDEATSALDSEVEAAIQDSLDALMADKTVIAIAHRLSTIARMDRLVVLDQGRIVETGTHADLLARGGHYAALWRRQSGGFLAESEAAE